MMLGNPIAREAETLGMLREVEAVLERYGAGRSGGDRGEIEDGQRDVHARDVSRSQARNRSSVTELLLTKRRPQTSTSEDRLGTSVFSASSWPSSSSASTM